MRKGSTSATTFSSELSRSAMIANLTRDHTSFVGADDNRLDADVLGDNRPPVLLLHGGGQTRHTWRSTAQKLASAGYTAYALDQRGHGTSEWVANGAYKFSDFSADVKLVATELTRRSGTKPIVVGASLGGIAALLAEGGPKRANGTHIFSALVLVDITPRVDMTGVNKILGFMQAHAKEGFASIADAAQIVAEYLPHRPRPKSNAGLKKNLRRSPDGRWRWHWDPRSRRSAACPALHQFRQLGDIASNPSCPIAPRLGINTISKHL
jgi:pimeloyl-ACP methyl ester carboxylesterase